MRRALLLPRAAPSVLVCMIAIAVLVVMTVASAGFLVTTSGPAGLFLLLLLAVAVLALPVRISEVPLPVRVALGALAAFVAWGYLSILWADSRGDAWDGANRATIYLVVFTLFALWPLRARGAAILLGGWTLAMAAIAAIVLIGIAGAADPLHGFVWDRQAQTAGYVNAAAAIWLMPSWPALVLAGRREVPWWLRGVFAAAAVGLVDLALLSQSRGALYSVPIALVVLFVAVPGRVRTLVALVPVAVAVAVTAPAVVHVFEPLSSGHPADAGRLPGVVGSFAIAALVAGLVVAGLGAAERAARLSRETERRVHLAVGAVGLGGVLVGVVVAIALAGSPTARARGAWDSFKGGYADNRNSASTRLISGLGSNRYDFYRVALNGFVASPWLGDGLDNFAQDYLRHGRSTETPRYPHSLELAMLSETGIVGSLLLLSAMIAALVAVALAMRRAEPLARAGAGGAAMVFVYFGIHGSGDWLWEFAGLGAPAWAMLGLGCALLPRRGRTERAGRVAAPGSRRTALAARWLFPGALGLAGLATAASLALPWISEAEVRSATHDWAVDPAAAYRSLDRAAALNPLSDRAKLIEGTIAMRLNDFARAREAFGQALERNPRGQYATLELGAIASAEGRRVQAARMLSRAVWLAPRDAIARDARHTVREGRRVDPSAMNRRILARSEALTR